jgi:hypothetical protein
LPEWISVREAAEASGYHSEYIRWLIKHDRIEARKEDPMWWIDRDKFRTYVEVMQAQNDKCCAPRRLALAQ